MIFLWEGEGGRSREAKSHLSEIICQNLLPRTKPLVQVHEKHHTLTLLYPCRVSFLHQKPLPQDSRSSQSSQPCYNPPPPSHDICLRLLNIQSIHYSCKICCRLCCQFNDLNVKIHCQFLHLLTSFRAYMYHLVIYLFTLGIHLGLPCQR